MVRASGPALGSTLDSFGRWPTTRRAPYRLRFLIDKYGLDAPRPHHQAPPHSDDVIDVEQIVRELESELPLEPGDD